MAQILNISQAQSLTFNESVSQRSIDRKFGLNNDFVELHIHNIGGQLIRSINNFSEYTIENPDNQGLGSEILMDPVEVLNSQGFYTGKYRLLFNFQRPKILASSNASRLFSVKNISSTRQEISLIAPQANNSTLSRGFSSISNEIASSPYFKSFVLNFGDNVNPVAINVLLDPIPRKQEILVKLSEPIPNSVALGDSCLIAEEIIDPLIIDIDLGEGELEDDSINLQGPNFKIDVRLNNSVPSPYKTYNDILSYNLTSSYENLLNHLENKEIPNIKTAHIHQILLLIFVFFLLRNFFVLQYKYY